MVSEKIWKTRVTYDKQDFFYPFWVNLAKKIKIVCLRWNSASRLIRKCWIRWWCLLFLLWTKNTLFQQIWSKKSKLFNMKLGIYTNSNMLNLLVMFTFSVLERKYPFWANLVQKDKIVCLQCSLVLRLIFNYVEVDDDIQIFSFRLEITFLGKFGSKRQSCLITMKLRALTNSNMLNSMVMFICPVLDQKYNFGSKLVQKIKTVWLR